MRTGSAKLFLILPQARAVATQRELAGAFRKASERPVRSRPTSHSAPVASANAASTPASPVGQGAQGLGGAVLERVGRRRVPPVGVAAEQVDVPVGARQERVEGGQPGREHQPFRELADEVLVAERDLGLHAAQAELRGQQGELGQPPVGEAEPAVGRLGGDLTGARPAARTGATRSSTASATPPHSAWQIASTVSAGIPNASWNAPTSVRCCLSACSPSRVRISAVFSDSSWPRRAAGRRRPWRSPRSPRR